MKLRTLLAAVLAVAAVGAAKAEGKYTPEQEQRALAIWSKIAWGEPDRRGEEVIPAGRPEYRGDRPNAPIPARYHVRNEGGSDGAGLCVISSILCNGMVQGIPGLEDGKGSNLWRTAKARRGGYSPDKLERLVNEVMPGEKWASYVGRDSDVLDRLSRQGYPIGATMNTGQLYNYRPIHHMISLASYRKGGLAWVVDNNRPDYYSVMPAAEYDRRWIDGGVGWAWIWTAKKAKTAAYAGLGAVVAVLTLAALFLAVGAVRRRGGDAPDGFEILN